jgi:hypothetical protein
MDCEEETKEQNDASIVTHLGKEPSIEDSKPAAQCVLVYSDNKTDNSFNRVAFSMPHPVLSKNPLTQNSVEHAAMTAKNLKDAVERKATYMGEWYAWVEDYLANLYPSTSKRLTKKQQELLSKSNTASMSNTSISSASSTPKKEAN